MRLRSASVDARAGPRGKGSAAAGPAWRSRRLREGCLREWRWHRMVESLRQIATTTGQPPRGADELRRPLCTDRDSHRVQVLDIL